MKKINLSGQTYVGRKKLINKKQMSLYVRTERLNTNNEGNT